MTVDTQRSLDVRTIRSASATELYITAMPARNDIEGIGRMYTEVAQMLKDLGAWIVEERVFAEPRAHTAVLTTRKAALGLRDDGIAPTLLDTREPETPVLGVQIHAISGIDRPQLLSEHGRPVGRAFDIAGCHYVTATGLVAPRDSSRPEQARQVFEQAERLVKQAGGSFSDIARTWIWMDDILGWYDQLNQVRNGFFNERGLFSGAGFMPASTGIGVSPVLGKIALDVFAAWGKPNIVERFGAVGNQRSASEYGSAFSRAARMDTPAGQTVFCSGTAAIDSAGKTCHAGDIRGQVLMTIENVTAVLRDMNCRIGDVVQAMAYCATPAVKEFAATHCAEHLPCPCLVLLGDVCRSDLLFEIEVTACH